MSSSGSSLAKYRIPLETIQSATQNFNSDNCVGQSSYAKLYKGNMSVHGQNWLAAIKRLNPDGKHAEREFQNKVQMLSNFNHENIVTFIGYCDEGGEMIIVSEFAVNRSVHFYLKNQPGSSCLTWIQRLKICIGAARGLEYLHSGRGGHNITIHRSVNIRNIVLDDNLEAKICSFGLSVIIDCNQPQVYKPNRYSHNYYVDPIYDQSGMLTTKADIYSFGVFLFIMLSGMLPREEVSGNNDKQRLLPLIRRCYHEGPDNLIDRHIRDQINIRSLHAFNELAYQCISWNLEDRPTMQSIVKRIEEALEFQNRAASTVTIQSHHSPRRESVLIPLTEIKLATRDFSPESRFLEVGSYGYKGQLSGENRTVTFTRLNTKGGIKEHEFRNDVEKMSTFKHENVISLIGYCDEGGEMITVSEFICNGSLYHLLDDPSRRECLRWEQRLKICIGAARGFDYLHSVFTTIHRNIASHNILLDDNLDAKICGFHLSLLLDENQPQGDYLPVGTSAYVDPIYVASGIANKELDIYSFGVVLFEIVSGKIPNRNKEIPPPISLIRKDYDGRQENLIDPYIKDQVNTHSVYVFKKIAYRCIDLNLKNRPTMKRVIKWIEEALDIQNKGGASIVTTRSLQDHLIPLKDINLATENFDPKSLIGEGGFGKVYKGKLSEEVAIKRLNPKNNQENKEFRTEIRLTSRVQHPNIIPFIGYCDEENEMIIVFKYAVNKSLDHFLENPIKMRFLTWEQCLNICLGAAKGIEYLHSGGLGMYQQVIHRDVKSGNILLDENMEANISDFGLAREGRNQQLTHTYTRIAGTEFYMDPIYYGSGMLRKESDVYSLGVVLLEMLSGRPAYRPTKFVDGDPQYLVNLFRRYYDDEPHKLIDVVLTDHIDDHSFHTFKELVYKCISFNTKERPTMDGVIDSIEDAIDFQEERQRERKASDADTPFNLKKTLRELKNEFCRPSSSEELYSYAFHFCLRDEKQNSIDIEIVCELLELVLGSRFRQQVDLFIKYLRTQFDYKVLNKEEWMEFHRFCNEINFTNFNNYDEKQNWPLILDNFVNWLRSKHSSTIDASDLEMVNGEMIVIVVL